MFNLLFSILLIFINFQQNNCDKNSKNCTCVPFYQCSEVEDGILITDGSDMIDSRQLDRRECHGIFDVCCNYPPKSTTEEIKIELNGCGYGNARQFEWFARLIFKEYKNNRSIHKCGVSFIHKLVAITAAHCLDDDGIWMVKLGNHTLHIRKIIIHPSFNSASLHNDIALIFVRESPIGNGTICVPPPGTFYEPDLKCLTLTDSDKIQTVIRLPLVSRPVCSRFLRDTRLGPMFELHPGFLCAGGDRHRDTCNGDGGNPLICPVPGQPGRYHQIGVVSWGIGCGEENVPGVYVNVAFYRNWIDGELRKNGLDPIEYRY